MLLRPRLSCEPQVLSYSLSFIAGRPLLPCFKRSPLSGNPPPVLCACLCSFHMLPRFLPSLSTKAVHKLTPTGSNHPKGPIAVSRQPVATPNPQQQFGWEYALSTLQHNSSSQASSAAATQPSVFGIQLTSSLQVQPTLPVNNMTTTATATTAANAGAGGGLFGNTNADQMQNTGRGLFGVGGGGGVGELFGNLYGESAAATAACNQWWSFWWYRQYYSTTSYWW